MPPLMHQSSSPLSSSDFTHREGNIRSELPPWLALVRKSAASLRFGSIQIKVHDGEIVQTETTQKYRLEDIVPETDLPPTEHSEAYPNKSSNAPPTRLLAAAPRNYTISSNKLDY